MFRKGEYVIYGNNGICCIERLVCRAIRRWETAGKNITRLRPVFSSGKIYAPLDTKVFMRPILTKAEAEKLILQIPEIRAEEVIGQDVRALGERYKGCLDTHRCEDLVRLIKTVYRKEKRLEENGKKLAKTEREYSKLAKELLHREFSMALEVPYDEVENYITEKVAALQK